MATPSLPEALARLDRFTNHEITSSSGIAAGRVAGLSLEPMRRLCSLLGDPQDAVPAIHITGTNGKGSVAAMATELVRASGLTVGTYTSPHLDRINERLRRDGEPIEDDELAEVLDGVMSVASMLEQPPSWFELVTAAAFRWFSESGVDLAVVEVGLLGRWDATNVVEADVSVITNVGPDHTDFAPGWQAAVAGEKAGIVVEGHDVVLGQLSAELEVAVAAEHPGRVLSVGREIEVIDSQLAHGGRLVSFATPWGRHDDVVLPVHGAHQGVNFAVAATAVEAAFERALPADVVEEAAAAVRLPGRCEVLSHQPLVVVDGAHNADAGMLLASTLEEEFSVIGSRIAIVGMLEGRDPADLLEALAPARFDLVIATRPDTPRGAPAESVARAAEAAGLPAEVVSDPSEAVERTLVGAGEEDLIVVCGSFYLVGPARQQLLALLAD